LMSPKKLFLSFVSLFILASLPLIGSVSASSELWSQTYGGDGMDACTSMIQTADGGFALFGFAHSFGIGSALFVKTDAYGNMEWNQTIGGCTASFIQTLDGGFAFVGTDAYSFDGYIPVGYLPDGFWSFVSLVKTDEFGNMEWNQTYDRETGHYLGSSLVQTTDGGYALVGTSFSYIGDYDDLILIKTDPYGNKEWSKSYGGPKGESDPELIQTSDEGFALVSKTHSDEGNADLLFIKTDKEGIMEWNQTYGSARMDWDCPTSLIQLSDGSFVLASATEWFGVSDFCLIKTDNNGNVEWNQTYGTENRDIFPSLAQTLDGGFALAGYTITDDEHLMGDFLLVKTDNRGNMLWNQTYLGAAVLGYPSLIQTVDGGFALSGGKGSSETEDCDFWLIKTDACGVPEFSYWIAILLVLIMLTLALAIYKQKIRKPKRGE
jgi:hypothetical protein